MGVSRIRRNCSSPDFVGPLRHCVAEFRRFDHTGILIEPEDSAEEFGGECDFHGELEVPLGVGAGGELLRVEPGALGGKMQKLFCWFTRGLPEAGFWGKFSER